jgi:lantibiotic modifying enzyme
VLVDCECLLQPEPAAGAAQLDDPLAGSCLATGMVSLLRVDPRGGVADIGGLCGAGGHLASDSARRWRHANTDAMEPFTAEVWAEPQSNLIRPGGEPILPTSRFAELCAGFAAAFDVVLSHRQELLTPGGPLSWFERLPTRVVVNDSNLYAGVMASLVEPAFQRSGWAQGVALEVLHRPLLSSGQRPLLWPLAAAERAALAELDIPYFGGFTDSRSVTSAGEAAEAVFARSGLEVARERLERLEPADLSRQLGLLRTVLAPSTDATSTVEPDPLLRGASSLAAEIEETLAARGLDPYPVAAPNDADSSLSTLLNHHGLYVGSTGVAVLFAALARVTGSAHYRLAALQLLAPLDELIAAVTGTTAPPPPIGACSGAGAGGENCRPGQCGGDRERRATRRGGGQRRSHPRAARAPRRDRPAGRP